MSLIEATQRGELYAKHYSLCAYVRMHLHLMDFLVLIFMVPQSELLFSELLVNVQEELLNNT